MKHQQRYLAGIALSGLACVPGAWPAPAGAAARSEKFAIEYSGMSNWQIGYRSTSPNPGGAPDHNRGLDTGTEQWALRFTEPLSTRCRVAVRCTELMRGASGTSSAGATIHHVHEDGLYSQLSFDLHCRLRYSTPARAGLAAELELVKGPRGVTITALDPVSNALDGLPIHCPGETDPRDGFADGMATPGFSFGFGYGPDRWFRSAPVTVPLGHLRHGHRIALRVRPSAGSAPPAGCAVAHPVYERCRVRGSWSGLLLLVPR